MRFNSLKDLDEDPIELNMTPLLDVLFVLLILFILIAPLLQIERVQLVHTKEKAKNLKTANFQTKSSLVIEVDKNNQISINEKKIKLDELEKTIQNLKIDKQIVPILLQDKKSEFGVYELIKQTLEAQDFKQLDVVLKS
jgi:biopolymer transport protein ExbD